MATVPTLERMAMEFDNRVQTVDGHRGWGQFLDGPVEHHQLGPYGTASGLIVRALAGRGHDTLGSQVESSLAAWCSESDEGYRKFWSQTLRLAFVHLALRASNHNADLANRLSAELLRRRLPGGLWGAWWAGPDLQDSSPRIVPSAMVLISHGLFGDDQTDRALLKEEARHLEVRIESGIRLSLFELAMAAAAVLSIRRDSLTGKARSRVAVLATELPKDVADLGVYFYEYRPVGATNQDTEFPRDYFIVPTAIAAALAGMLPGAPSDLQYRAHEIATSLQSELEKGDGLYRPSPENRVATKNQAWASLLLSAVQTAGKPRWFAGVRLALIRSRPDNKFTSIILPILAWAAVVVIPILTTDSWWARGLLAAVALVAGGVYPPTRILPKWVRRREW